MTNETICRLHDRETKSRRVVLVARAAAGIPTGTPVALFDISGELFLGVLEGGDTNYATRRQIANYQNANSKAPLG